jgi:sugar lactone lactonase YvrE
MNFFTFRNRIKPSHLFAGLTFSLLFFLSSFNSSAQIINTIAGDSTSGYNRDNIQSTAAELYDPYGVAVDSTGNVYIADWANNRIRKITISTGIITTIAGTGTAGYNGDGILATSAKLNFPRAVAVDRLYNVYIADATNGRIRKVDAITGMISTVAGTGTSGYNGDSILATNAKVNDPVGLCVDVNLNIYIADLLNERIRKVDQTNDTIYTVAGNGTSGYNGDYIPPLSAELKSPSGVAVDAEGNIFIADTYNFRIRMVGVSTGLIFTICGTGVQGYNGNNITASTARVNYPFGLFEDQAGFLYYADAGNNLVRKIDHSTGLVHNVAGNLQSGYDGDGILATSASLNYPTGVCIAHDGTGYIADSYNQRVRVISGLTTDVPNISNSSEIVTVYPNPFSDNATIYINGVTTNSNSTIEIYNMMGQEIRKINMGTDTQITIHRDNLASGIYFYKLNAGTPNSVPVSGKFIVE